MTLRNNKNWGSLSNVPGRQSSSRHAPSHSLGRTARRMADSRRAGYTWRLQGSTGRSACRTCWPLRQRPPPPPAPWTQHCPLASGAAASPGESSASCWTLCPIPGQSRRSSLESAGPGGHRGCFPASGHGEQFLHTKTRCSTGIPNYISI